MDFKARAGMDLSEMKTGRRGQRDPPYSSHPSSSDHAYAFTWEGLPYPCVGALATLPHSLHKPKDKMNLFALPSREEEMAPNRSIEGIKRRARKDDITGVSCCSFHEGFYVEESERMTENKALEAKGRTACPTSRIEAYPPTSLPWEFRTSSKPFLALSNVLGEGSAGESPIDPIFLIAPHSSRPGTKKSLRWADANLDLSTEQFHSSRSLNPIFNESLRRV
ncbi:hypothetical protein Tco_0129288 [Tanacetum coccineum]